MANIGDVVRRLDYQKRAKNTLGVKRASRSTKLQECSSFVKSANEHQVDILQSAVRKMEADEKLFRDGYSKQLCTVKKFHNTVHSRSTNFHDFSLGDPSTQTSDNRTKTKTPGDIFTRRGSLNFPATMNQASNQKRRHSVQADSSKYGRSFRKLKEAIAPKSRISPEPVAKSGQKSVTEDSPCVLLVSEARVTRGLPSSV